MIYEAAKSVADAIKFQTFDAEKLISNKAQLKIGSVDLFGITLFICCRECKRLAFSTENFILFLSRSN